ncbi:MAG: hypothetical protein K0Q55_1800 [Verrucomicrobia bacterium]|jgi:hypothetical protein|nr:hypothetical protein [Verrucomicrobiota bacterium]
MKWLFILLFIINCPQIGLALSTQRNACLANLKQIDGAAQQWALENKLDSTNRYNLRDSTITQYLKGGQLPECPSGGVYVAGRTIDNAPRCTLHGSMETLDYWRDLQSEMENQMLRTQLVLALVAAVGIFLAIVTMKQAVTQGQDAAERVCLVQPLMMLIAALLVSLLRFWIPQDFRWDFFLWMPTLVFALAGFGLAVKALKHRPKKEVIYLVTMALMNFLLLAPIVYGLLQAGLRSLGIRI